MKKIDKIVVAVVDGCCEEKSRKNHETRREFLSPYLTICSSLDEFLCFEVTSEIQHLPSRQTKQTAHAEYTKEQYSVICRLYKRRQLVILKFQIKQHACHLCLSSPLRASSSKQILARWHRTSLRVS